MLRIFRKKSNAAEAQPSKIAYCIPRNVLFHALFDDGAPLADLPTAQKTVIANAVEDRLYSVGWRVELSAQALNLRSHEYHRKLREMESRGGVFLDHIKTLIDRAYDHYKAKDRMGRGVPQPFPIGADRWCQKMKPGEAHE